MKNIVLKNLSAGYSGSAIIENINFTISQTESVLIEGPNGAGKTTLLKTIAGILNPVSGSLNSDFKSIGYVPQIRNIDDTFPASVEECLQMSFIPNYIERVKNLFFHFLNQGKDPVLAEQKKQIEDSLSKIGMLHKRKTPLRDCSGGELQRVLIARALIHKPDLLILDEPMSFLDRTAKSSLIKFLKELHAKKGPALIMTVHDDIKDNLFNRKILVENRNVTEIKSRKRKQS